MDAASIAFAQAGWQVGLKPRPSFVLPGELALRYLNLPRDYVLWIGAVERCVNAAETVWFLCERDFNGSAVDGAQSIRLCDET